MPEGIEVELYRRALLPALGRTVAGVDAPDPWFLGHGLDAPTLRAALVGRTLAGARRRGKLLMVDLDGSAAAPTVLGLRFGMTGRLVVDGRAPVEALVYGPARDLASWDRLVMHLDGGGTVRLNDPRRLGGVELDPDLSALGPDVFEVGRAAFAAALGGSGAPVKARLMDQRRLAGLGNLLTDEALWRAGLDPARPAAALAPAEVARLYRCVRETVAELLAAGGSHLGHLQPARVPGGRCPKDGAPLVRRTVAGRTTFSCPRHQR